MLAFVAAGLLHDCPNCIEVFVRHPSGDAVTEGVHTAVNADVGICFGGFVDDLDLDMAREKPFFCSGQIR